MVERIFKTSLGQRMWVLLGVAVLIAVGTWSATRLSIDAVPDITNVQVQINTSIGSLAAEEIEKQITFPIETEMQGLQGLVEMRSISRFGLSQLTLVFDEQTGELSIMRGKTVIAKTTARLEKLESKAKRTEIHSSGEGDNAELISIIFAGKDQSIVVTGNSGSSTGNN